MASLSQPFHAGFWSKQYTNNSNLTSITGDQEVNDFQNDQIDPKVADTVKVQDQNKPKVLPYQRDLISDHIVAFPTVNIISQRAILKTDVW